MTENKISSSAPPHPLSVLIYYCHVYQDTDLRASQANHTVHDMVVHEKKEQNKRWRVTEKVQIKK